MGAFTSDGTENRMRWDRRGPSWLEVWYATINHRVSGLGVWLRYTILAPGSGRSDARCELWGFVFDPEGKRSFGARNRFSIDRLGTPNGRDDGALVRIGDAWLSDGRLEGHVERDGRVMTWSLEFEPADRCYQHIPDPLRGPIEKRGSALCSPNLSVPFTGSVVVGGETFEFDGDLGCQSHRWGRRHPVSWSWAHCSGFDEDPTGVFEGVAARAAVGPATAPTTTLLFLRYDGQDLVFNDLKWALRARSRYELPTWAFTAHNAEFKIAGAGRAAPERFVQVAYEDPDGSMRYCTNTEIADMAIEIYRRTGAGWRHAGSLTGLRHAGLEFGRREPFAEVPIAF